MATSYHTGSAYGYQLPYKAQNMATSCSYHTGLAYGYQLPYRLRIWLPATIQAQHMATSYHIRFSIWLPATIQAQHMATSYQPGSAYGYQLHTGSEYGYHAATIQAQHMATSYHTRLRIWLPATIQAQHMATSYHTRLSIWLSATATVQVQHMAISSVCDGVPVQTHFPSCPIGPSHLPGLREGGEQNNAAKTQRPPEGSAGQQQTHQHDLRTDWHHTGYTIS